MSKKVKIATLTIDQLAEIDIDKSKTLYDSVIDFIHADIKKVLVDKPDLIVLPEHCGRQTGLPERITEYKDSGTLKIFEYLKNIAKENNCYIVFSRYKKMEDGTVRNCATMIDRNGEINGEYHKNYPTPEETECGGIVPGKEVPVFYCDFGTVCPIICFDLNFDAIRKEIKKKNPDIITFHSAFHGGLLQDYFAYDTRSYLVSSLSNYKPSRIISPLGEVVATTTNYTAYTIATINLDYIVCHLDCNMPKFNKAKEKYGDKLKISDPGYIGSVLLSYEGDDQTIIDVVNEFEIESLDEYMNRCIITRDKYKEK